MITEAIVGSAVGIGILIGRVDKSMKLDDQALNKLAKAYTRQADANRIIAEAEKKADTSVLKLANRKKAILSITVRDFLNVYEQIQKVEFTEGAGIKELNSLAISKAEVGELKSVAAASVKVFTDKEMITGVLFHGIGTMMVKESEAKVSAANSQMRAANVAYSQAETITTVYEAISDRAEKMASLLARMNVLLTKSIKAADAVISKNGLNPNTYSQEDLNTLVNMVNWMAATKDVLDVSLLNQNGELEQKSAEAIAVGEEYIAKMNEIL